jgi:hypothetical protein
MIWCNIFLLFLNDGFFWCKTVDWFLYRGNLIFILKIANLEKAVSFSAKLKGDALTMH